MKSNIFTNQYSLSKTLRFELIPQGKTLEYINSKGLLDQDNNRAISYQKVKKIIDEYHKVFIEDSIKGTTINVLKCEIKVANLYSDQRLLRDYTITIPIEYRYINVI